MGSSAGGIACCIRLLLPWHKHAAVSWRALRVYLRVNVSALHGLRSLKPIKLALKVYKMRLCVCSNNSTRAKQSSTASCQRTYLHWLCPCRVAFILSFVCGIGALVIVWLLYPKDIAYGTALKDSVLFYNAQQIGTLPANYPVSWRGNAYLQASCLRAKRVACCDS